MTEAKMTEMTNRPVVTIKLASTSDELMQCYMLRAAVFMGEQHCPYWEEFDGNDYTASHIIVYVDGEPAASMRVRWFAIVHQARARRRPASATARWASSFLSCAGPWSSGARRATPRHTCTASIGCGRYSSAVGFRKVD